MATHFILSVPGRMFRLNAWIAASTGDGRTGASHVGEVNSITKTGLFIFHTISTGTWGYGAFVGTEERRVVTSLGNHVYTDTSPR